jgi:hypothetical protein
LAALLDLAWAAMKKKAERMVHPFRFVDKSRSVLTVGLL